VYYSLNEKQPSVGLSIQKPEINNKYHCIYNPNNEQHSIKSVNEQHIIHNGYTDRILLFYSQYSTYYGIVKFTIHYSKKPSDKFLSEILTTRDANPLQNSGWFGLWVSKICYFEFGFGFRVFKNPTLGLVSGSGFENFPKNRVLGSGLGWVL
jgi:hypothetical protein